MFLSFHLPGLGEIKGAGQVVWKTNGRAGIQFVKLADSARSLLQSWISVEASRFAAPAGEVPQQTATSLPGQGEEHRFDKDDEFSRALALAAQQALEITCAQGAAIALGDERGMVCRASAGLAPSIGTPLSPHNGLSGLCLCTRKVVLCQDTSTDPNVDVVACQQLNLRSVIIVPILSGQQLGGVLEVFSSRPGAFSPENVASLSKLAGLTSSRCGKRPVEDPAHIQATIPKPESGAAHLQRDEHIKIAAPDATGIQVCDVCDHKNSPHVTVCENCDVPLPSALSFARTRQNL
jgi:hypothetical protein